MRNRDPLPTTMMAALLSLGALGAAAQERDAADLRELAGGARAAADKAALHWVGFAQLEAKDFNGAVETVEELGSLCPRSLEVANNLAVAWAAAGDSERAASELGQAARELQPASAETANTVRRNRRALEQVLEFRSDSEALAASDALDLVWIDRVEPCVAAPVADVEPSRSADQPAPGQLEAAEAEEAEGSDQEEDEPIGAAIGSWADAWQEQRVDDYLAAYSARFTPPAALSRQDWEDLRRGRILRKEFIQVGIADLELVEETSDTALTVRFRQDYRSNDYSDTVTKQLGLVLEDGAWKILSETVVD